MARNESGGAESGGDEVAAQKSRGRASRPTENQVKNHFSIQQKIKPTVQ